MLLLLACEILKSWLGHRVLMSRVEDDGIALRKQTQIRLSIRSQQNRTAFASLLRHPHMLSRSLGAPATACVAFLQRDLGCRRGTSRDTPCRSSWGQLQSTQKLHTKALAAHVHRRVAFAVMADTAAAAAAAVAPQPEQPAAPASETAQPADESVLPDAARPVSTPAAEMAPTDADGIGQPLADPAVAADTASGSQPPASAAGAAADAFSADDGALEGETDGTGEGQQLSKNQQKKRLKMQR